MNDTQQTNTDAMPMAEQSIRTARLILRPIRIDDAAAILAILSQGEVARWLGNPMGSQTRVEDWIRRTLDSPKEFSFAILLPDAEQDHASGSSTISNASRIIGSMGAALPSVGFSLDPSCWGKGYATEALRAVIARYWEVWPNGHPLLDESDRKSLVAGTRVDNVASQNVLVKAGFAPDGEGQLITEKETIVTKKWRAWGPGFAPND